MAEFPLLPAPKPIKGKRPKGNRRGASKLNTPNRTRQQERIGPAFSRLQSVFNAERDPMTLRDDPTGIAPERAIVFEVADSISDFQAALSKVNGQLEFLVDEELPFDPDDDFVLKDDRKGKEGQLRSDKPVIGRLYAAMPDTLALRHLVSLWGRWQRNEPAPTGLASWYAVFQHLHAIRAWGPQDRVSDETIEYLTDALEHADSDESIRMEVELWHRRGVDASKRFDDALAEAGGEIVHSSNIPEIGYVGRLINLPSVAVRQLIARDEVTLTICDDVMFVRPQSTVTFPIDNEALDAADDKPVDELSSDIPIAALFDGMPIQAHQLLDGRLVLDDPDDLDALSVVADRVHGTQMASLILHGDRNLDQAPLNRPIYCRPVLYAPGGQQDERPLPDRLLIDLIYRAILRMKEGDNEGPATAPDVFLVNLSLGDRSRPFSGPISPWARLLDHLADRYGILFLVSAGNISAPLTISNISGTTEFEDASPEEREAKVLDALADAQAFRTLLSPAESVNAITVGGLHDDAVNDTFPAGTLINPYVNGGAPNISSAMGLGHRKTIKPDILMPGGRERVRISTSGGGSISIQRANPGRIFGIRAAMPNPQGLLNREGLSAGTSAATALATRAAHQIFDALSDPENGNLLEGVDPAFYGVIVKAMLTHRAQWGALGTDLENRWPPQGQGTHVARRDGIARVLGYGQPIVDEVLNCASHRATMVGYGAMPPGEDASVYKIPLPPSLAGVIEPRALTVTLAWFSPVNITHQMYRQAKLEVKPDNEETVFGVTRQPAQPSDKSTPRGSLFHVRYTGDKAVAFIDNTTLALKVFCREQGGSIDKDIRFGFAVTVEAGEAIPLYEEVRQGLGLGIRAGAAP